MGNKIKKILSLIEKIEIVTMCFILIFIIGVLFIEIIFRYFLSGSLGWPQEVSLRLIIWATYLGVSVLYKKDQLLNIDILYKRLPKILQHWILLLYNISVLIVISITIKYLFVLYRIQSLRTLTTVNIPQSIGLWGPIAAFLLTIPMILFKIYNNISLIFFEEAN